MKPLTWIKTRFVLLIWKLTPDCLEMSRLASLRLDQPLPRLTRLRVRLHFLICEWCGRYQRQLSFLHKAAQTLQPRTDLLASTKLSESAKRRMVQCLRDECGH